MSKKSVGFGKVLRKYMNKPNVARRMLSVAISAELARRKVVAGVRNDFVSWMDYHALHAVNGALSGVKTAWVNLFFPVEILLSFGVNCVSAEGLAGMFAAMYLEDIPISRAESFGISRNLCTFHRTGVGISLLKVLPKPIFVATTNILCDGNMPTFNTYSVLNNIPIYVIDVPRYESSQNESYLSKQLENLVYNLENHLGRRFDYSKLVDALRREKESFEILREFYPRLCESPLSMELYQHVNVLYAFHMRPNQLVKAVRSLTETKAVLDKKIRLLWLHMIPYYDNELYKIFSKNSPYAVVTSEFEWDWLYWYPDPEKPFISLAQKVLKNPEIGDLQRRAQFVTKLAQDFKVNGVIHFNHWGCKQSSGSVFLLKEVFEEQGIPFLALDGDCVDHTNQSIGQYKTRIEAFLEMIR